MAHLGGGGGEARVRVVRCPNCDKLLPEIPNLALYRCGGCNAALQGTNLASGLVKSCILRAKLGFFLANFENFGVLCFY